MCIFGIFSNTALFCFTAHTFTNVSNPDKYRFIAFGFIVIAMLLLRNQIQNIIADLPENYETVQARHEYIVNKILRKEKGNDIEEEIETYDGALYFAKKSDRN